jgi:DNA-binding response OmpR family regulator
MFRPPKLWYSKGVFRPGPGIAESALEAVPIRVLIIDDNEPHADGLAELLHLAGFCASQVHTGVAGIEYAIANPVDAILLDMKLPDMSGTEVCKTLQDDPRTAHIAIVYHTGSQPARGDRYGGDAFLTYPIGFEELFAVIRGSVLRRRTEYADKAAATAGRAMSQ